MQTSISMPSVLKAVVTLKMWLSNENELASSFMEESVTNIQIVAVVMVVLGLMMIPFLFGSMPYIGIIGFGIAIVGSTKLGSYGEE